MAESVPSSDSHARRGRIAVVLPDLRGGGAERVTLTLVEQFAAMGHDVDLVLGKARGELLADVPEAVNLMDLATPRLRKLPLVLARYLKQAKPVAVLAVMQEINCIAVVARQLSGVKCRLVLSEHSQASQHIAALPNRRGRWFMSAAVRWCYSRADEIVAVSEGVASDLKQNIGLQGNRPVSIIYNPVDVDALTSKSREKVIHPWLPASDDEPVLIAVGSIKPAKDFATLVRAFSSMRERHRMRLIILGDGSERTKIEHLAAELGVSDDVSLPGYVSNPWAWMAKASMFVSSSKWEGFPMVLIEALALGLPVVATDCPSGPREALDGGRVGRLVPVGQPDVLADVVCEALDQSSDPAELIARAREFSPPSAASRYLEILS